MTRMNILDASWLFVESPEAPMHVGNLTIYKLPENASEDFLRKVAHKWRETKEFHPPFNLKLPNGRLSGIGMKWKVDDDLDIDYHFRHSALPRPGGERELGVLISRLHSHPLDFNRPLWECHLIEGLENDRFAIYFKCHHSLIDGVSGVRMLQRILSDNPRKKNLPAPWSVPPAQKAPRGAPDLRELPSTENAARAALSDLRGKVRTAGELRKALRKVRKSGKNADDPMKAPFECPQTILNQRITPQRRFATQQYSLERVRNLAKMADGTVNDIVLAISASAIRRYLKEANALPKEPLTAGLPVNVRPADDQGTGNAISFIMVSLATNIANPVKRLRAIQASVQSAKEHLQSLPKAALQQYTSLIMAPFMLQLATGLGGRMRSVFNVTISNVPGPQEHLYYDGARLEATFPVSLIPHGQGVNITCVSYADTLNFGLTGCRDTVPHLQHMAVYMGEALEELEAALGG